MQDTCAPVMAGDLHLLAALWVPVPETGEVSAGMVLDLLVDHDGEPPSRDEWLRIRENEQTPNLVRRYVERCDVPLGEAVLVIEVARDDVGSLELRVEITIFPDTCRDGLQVTVLSPRLDCEDLLVGEAALWADHLKVRTAP